MRSQESLIWLYNQVSEVDDAVNGPKSGLARANRSCKAVTHSKRRAIDIMNICHLSINRGTISTKIFKNEREIWH
jgi:hypothetical protein